MNDTRKALPIGIDNFYDIRHNDFCYIDKTCLIQRLLDTKVRAMLFTRPRRFGKSLALNMLQRFFDCNEKEQNRPLFDGLAVAQSERYMSEQGKYPVIFLNLKEAKCDTLDSTANILRLKLRNALLPFSYLLKSEKLESTEKDCLARLVQPNASLDELSTSFDFVCSLLAKHHGQPVVILVDEYDTPLQSAYMHGFYQPICDIMRNMFSSALKSNNYLRLGVVTGVMRIAKESLFSGLNNLQVDTILSDKYADCFGFTQAEVNQLADSYGAHDKIDEIKDWYDGYRFGQLDIYNPWSVIRYFDNGCQAQPYWLQTSSNDLVKEFLFRLADIQRRQVFDLYNGGSVVAALDTSVTYPQLQSISPDRIFSLLTVSGYLKPIGQTLDGDYRLVIPNQEISKVYESDILSYIEERIDMPDLVRLRRAIVNGDEELFAELLRQYMVASLSYYDNLESFYHGWMMGILLCMISGYTCKSNREAGHGRADIILTPRPGRTLPGLVFELKHCDDPEQLPQKAEEALRQIENKRYPADFPPEIKEVLGYGISFCRKRCAIVQKKWSH